MKKKYILMFGLTALAATCLAAGCATAPQSDPYDESGFAGSSNDYSDELATDSFITIDGNLSEDCWQGQKVFDYTYQGVRVQVTTVFGDLGFYVGYTVTDPHVYGVSGRAVWMGSSVEMYIDRGDTIQKSVRSVQYRLSALNEAEILNGYITNEDAWTACWLPIYGRTQVQGTINSGSTQGMTAEVFVRWDALGYDYAAEDFAPPESVKIMPVYNQSSGAELTSPRDYWVNNGGDLNNPLQYWLFDGEGFCDADAENAVIGDSAYGRAKSPGWDVSRESEGIVTSDVSGDQWIFFTDINAPEYVVTALVTFNGPLKYWSGGDYVDDPYPKAGIILASGSTLHAYLLDYERAKQGSATAEGMFFDKGNPDPRETWSLYDASSLAGVCDTSRPVRLTGVKYGRYLLVFAGDEDTPQYGGTFIGMQEITGVEGNAAPGFYALGCSVTFSDYAVTTDEDAVLDKIGGVLSVLTIQQASGGALTADRYGYEQGETATITAQTYAGYRLTSLLVNGTDRIGDLSEYGELTVQMDSDVTVIPTFTREEQLYTVSGAFNLQATNASSGTVTMTVRGDGVFLQSAASRTGEYSLRLPDGTYTMDVYVDGVIKTNVPFAVDGADVAMEEIDIQLNWVFDGSVSYAADGSLTVKGFNQFRAVSNLSGTAFVVETSLKRADGNFNVSGTWETGGIGIRVDGTVYRIYVMREGENGVVVYLGVDGGASCEYRQGGTYTGTGAPISLKLAFLDGEIHLLLDGRTHYVLNTDNTADALDGLFTSDEMRSFGFVTIGKDMIFSDFDFAVGEEAAQQAIGEMRASVTLPADVTGVSVTADTLTPWLGGSVQLSVSVENDYSLTSFKVNGAEHLSDLTGGVYVVTNVTGDIVVEVTVQYAPAYTVSGTYTYAQGLYAQGDTVTVSSGAASGTAEDGAWTIALADGEHTVTLTSARFMPVTVLVTVEGGAVTVNDPVTFSQIRFNEGNTYTDEGLVIGTANTLAVFSGFDGADGFRVDTTLERTDGNFGVSGTWSTGGFLIGKNGINYRLFVMRENGSTVVLYLNNWTNWAQQEFRVNYAYPGTGAPLDVSLVYLGDAIYVRIGNSTCILKLDSSNVDESFLPLVTKGDDDVVQAGLVTVDCAVRFTDFSYSAVSALPDDYIVSPTAADTFTDNTGAYELSDGSIVVQNGLNKQLDNGSGGAVTASGDFLITYSLRRDDGWYSVNGSWDTGGFLFSVGGQIYKLFLMRENDSSAVIYLMTVDGSVTKEYRIPYGYAGTGAPLTMSVAYNAADESLHLYIGGAHYMLTAELTNNEGLSGAFVQGNKTLGLFTNSYWMIFSDISYTTDAEQVAAQISEWGASDTPTVS